MGHSLENNSKINESCLRIICNDKQSSFNAHLEKDGSVSVHKGNIKILQS